jgi:hypothetical protein
MPTAVAKKPESGLWPALSIIAWIARALNSNKILDHTDDLVLGSFSPEHYVRDCDRDQQKWSHGEKRVISQGCS